MELAARGSTYALPSPASRDMGYFGLQLRDEPKVSSQKSWNKKESDLGIG